MSSSPERKGWLRGAEQPSSEPRGAPGSGSTLPRSGSPFPNTLLRLVPGSLSTAPRRGAQPISGDEGWSLAEDRGSRRADRFDILLRPGHGLGAVSVGGR